MKLRYTTVIPIVKFFTGPDAGIITARNVLRYFRAVKAPLKVVTGRARYANLERRPVIFIKKKKRAEISMGTSIDCYERPEYKADGAGETGVYT